MRLRAVADEGAEFVEWRGGGLDGSTDASMSITPERYTEVTAVSTARASSANRVYVSVETLDGTVLSDRSSHYAETAFADGGGALLLRGRGGLGQHGFHAGYPMPRKWRRRA